MRDEAEGENAVCLSREDVEVLWLLHREKISKSFPSPLIAVYRLDTELNYRAGVIKPDGFGMLWHSFVCKR